MRPASISLDRFLVDEWHDWLDANYVPDPFYDANNPGPFDDTPRVYMLFSDRRPSEVNRLRAKLALLISIGMSIELFSVLFFLFTIFWRGVWRLLV